ncbi:MAG: single-stranded DNA-binding protein [Candidatus Obscuribacter sp.]|jgi:single-strand DNA-binding protein|nr:single-stranded DNA-binding protein [Candidatus Obscuribacter sp.]MDQ5965209.1 single-strand DNA-binding protein [Cyanobacteriota bacterium erpe_2018_sw_39hr_WHONDRS-SW48-000098_B_bin.30]MBK7837681.1 single-stranded DNA-binding protein [Candidatus Obscuribacter sp.]MBK9206498.1 single-stranded DNA-binding protein [Candidatus Obscuribacter sp.]MBK9618391.1 single-stranded DNA-binding protein [Candidatus Obscuribacter sp.]
MSLSKVVISGRVVKAPEKRFTPNTNTAVTEFTIGVDSPNRQDGGVDTNFVKVITWRDLAERCAQEIKKGDIVCVDGRLQINNYANAEGQKKRDVEIDANAVENLSQTVNASGRTQSSDDGEEKLAKVSSAPKGKAKAADAEDLDAIFSSEDEIPF